MSSVSHPLPSRMNHNVAALFGHSDDTLVAWQQACAHAADALRPQPDPERLAKALALAQQGAVALDDDGAALVTSGVTRYHADVGGTCSCPDAQHRGVPCKHTLAVQIHQQATASLAPNASAAPPPAATPPAVVDTYQERLPSANRWDVKEAPASACLRLRVGELEILYTMRDVSDAELTSRVQHLVPWVQDLVDQARERQTLLDTLRQQREAAHTAPSASAPPAPQAPSAPADLQALLQQAVQQALDAHAPSHRTPPATGQAPNTLPPAPPSNGTAAQGAAPASQDGWCALHRVAMELRSNAKGAWHSHWLAAEARWCRGK